MRLFYKEQLRKYRFILMGIGIALLTMLAGWIFWRRKKRTQEKPKEVGAVGEDAAVKARQDMERQLAEREAAQRLADEAKLLELRMPQVTSSKARLLKQVLVEDAQKETTATVQLLRSWIHEDER